VKWIFTAHPARAIHGAPGRYGRGKGLTLIELLVTIIVLSILLAVAMPNFSSLIDDQRLKNAASDLYAALVYARSEAIKRNHFVAICAKNTASDGCLNATDWAKGWIVFLDSDGDGAPNAASDIIKKQDEIAAIAFSGPSGTVSYTGNGQLRASVSTFRAAKTENSAIPSRCVNLDLMGRPRMTKGC